MKNPTAARDFFLHLFSTILLYMGVVSLLTLLFAIVDKYVPDALASLDSYYYEQGLRDMARFSIAMLLVTTPIYFWSMRFISKTLKTNPELKEFKPRRWLMYLTIFAAAIIIVITLITVVWRFLNGETTTRFLLKVLSVLTVSAAMFWYYLNDAKGEKEDHRKYIAWTSILVIIVSIVGGFFVMGSPAEERARRFDRERTSDLQQIQWGVEETTLRERAIPESLEDVDSISFETRIDPETGEQYIYRVEENAVTVCATFSTESDVSVSSGYSYRLPRTTDIDWNHTVGENCYTFEVHLNSVNVTSFNDCVTAGNPVLESYPRQCVHNGVTYVEDGVVLDF